ncbi:MAG TPA: hypothetical protein VG456_26760 [Candidatus Sulfopaludibacter sp.]|jgi:hypothetical protein|nr:hypothetical protein [Candidatus Sulfopaludibacter sp.]
MRVDLGKLSKVVGGVVLGLVALGMIINMKDIRRYVRISTM